MNEKIISVSRRTDIPAFYGEWFMNAIKRGFVDSLNPFNRKYVSRVSLKPQDVICFVFWSKNPKPFMKYLDSLDSLSYKYYFQFTLNPYSTDLETQVPNKGDHLIETFKELSNRIGKDKVIWRYDPIIINNKYTILYHVKYFDYLAQQLANYTNRVMISFVDWYQKTKRNMESIDEMDEETQNKMAEQFSSIAKKVGLTIYTCSETIDLDQYGIKHGKCIDDTIVREIVGDNYLNLKRDKGQRKACGCVESIDIGTSNTCKHFCTYCYANTSRNAVIKKIANYDKDSTILCERLLGHETIHWRNGELMKDLKSLIKIDQEK